MNWAKYISGASLVMGLLALVVLWATGPSLHVLYLLAFWVALWTIGHLAKYKPSRVSWTEHLSSITQAISAVVMAGFTMVLANTTELYTAFTKEIKNYQKESFIFTELAKDHIRPITLKLTCDCQRIAKQDVHTYECNDFSLRLANNASVRLRVANITAWVQKGIDDMDVIATRRNIDLPMLFPNEKVPLASQVNTNLAHLSEDIDTVYVTTEYYTPTLTLLSHREAFSFPVCRRKEEK